MNIGCTLEFKNGFGNITQPFLKILKICIFSAQNLNTYEKNCTLVENIKKNNNNILFFFLFYVTTCNNVEIDLVQQTILSE